MTWDSPPPSPLGDHDVQREGSHLDNRRIALLLTGGIAAMRAPFVARALRRQGATVVAYATEEALRYTTTDALEWATTNKVVTRLTPAAEHLSDSAPFDAYLLPQATYNTINKLRHGIADTVVTTTLASALGRMERGVSAVLLAPAMHGSMHNAILRESLSALAAMGVRVIPPRQEDGKDKIPTDPVLVAEVCRATSRSPLRGKAVLVTGGPTPVPIDNIRRLTNKFTGALGTLIATELYLMGADVTLVHGESSQRPPDWLPHTIARTYDHYKELVLSTLAARDHLAGVFTAAVADYRPREVAPGKIASGGALQQLDLVPTEKVIQLVREAHPALHMVTFKYEELLDHDALMAIARGRLEKGYDAVVANRGEESGPRGEQVAWLVTPERDPQRVMGKAAIAALVAAHIERIAAR